MSLRRYALILASLAILTGVGVGASLAALLVGTKPGTRTYDAHKIRTFVTTRRIIRAPQTLETLNFLAHGGHVVVEWYCGSWSPLLRSGASEVSLYIDGRRVASTFLNGSGGTFSARAGILRWIGRLSATSHFLSVSIDQATGGVALPLVLSPGRVPEGIDVTEYVS